MNDRESKWMEVIGCDIGVGFDTISAIQHWNENKQMNEWMNE